MRDFILPKLWVYADASKAFEGVLLEQVVVVCSKKKASIDFIETAEFMEKIITNKTRIKREIFSDFSIFIAGISDSELSIPLKLLECDHFDKVCYITRGFLLQDYLSKSGEVMVFRGDSIGRYELYPPRDFITLKNFQMFKNKLNYMLQPKILIQNIVAHITQPTDHIIMMSTYDSKGVINLDTICNIFLTDEKFSPYFLVSLFNSRFISWYAYRFVYGKAIRTMHFDQYHLEKLPLPIINFTTPSKERTTLLESLKSKYIANEFDKILKIVEECLPKDEKGNFITEKEKNDVIHDLLAFLAERMIEMNKEKNGETKGFLEWLEREIKTEIDKLTNRTKLKAYYELKFDELLEILKKNKKKISITLSNREFQDNLKKEFEKSKVVLSPLRKKIEATDKLIDQIVYELYGLTDEEIKIVESSLSIDSNENMNEESENE